MRVKFLLLVAMCLAFAASAYSQNVIENISGIKIDKKGFTAELAISHNGQRIGSLANVEVLGIKGELIGKAAKTLNLRNGTHKYNIVIPANPELLKNNSSDLPWFRLRYSLADSNGIMSFSDLIDEFFITRTVTQEYIVHNTHVSADVYVTNPFNNRPISGVKVTATLTLELETPESEDEDDEDDDEDDDQEYELKLTAISDANGTAKFKFPLKGIEHKIDDAYLDIEASKNGVTTSDFISLESFGKNRSFAMISDKPIYQPEQMLHLRGLLMESNESYTVLTGKILQFRIEDEEGVLLYREKVTTSEFGMAAISWQIPANAKLGTYDIEVLDENNRELVTKSIKITRYDLPNFVVSGKSEKKYYLPGEDKAEVEVSAEYLFGQPVAKGKVRVVREKDRTWNWREQKYDIEEGESHEGETDEEGKYKAIFELKDDQQALKKNENQNYKDLTFTAYFTDLTTNRTEERRFDVRLSREPIHIYYRLNSSNLYKNMPTTVYASANYADGEEFRGKLTLLASDEDKEDFQQFAAAETNSLGIATLTFTPKSNSDLDLKLIASDAEGRTGYVNTSVTFSDDDKLFITTDKNIYKPGETIKINVRSNLEEGEVIVHIMKSVSELAAIRTPLKQGKAELLVPFDSKYSGELTVGAYMLTSGLNEELVTGSTGIIFPAPIAINADVKFDKAIYKPGEDVSVDFSIVDAAGRAIQSALGIIVLDKAVEERAKTDGLSTSMFSAYDDMLGYGQSFAGINVKTIHELDLTKNISDEMHILAAAIMVTPHYSPRIDLSSDPSSHSIRLFAGQITDQFKNYKTILTENYNQNKNEYPKNETELKAALKSAGIDLKTYRDPWDMPYHVKFDIEKNREVISLISSGVDKTLGTKDDITAASHGFDYFLPIGKRIDATLEKYVSETSKPVTDEETFYEVIDMEKLIDKYGRPYQIEFTIRGRQIHTSIRSLGKDGVSSGDYYWWGDDFNVWTSSQDFFESTGALIIRALNVASEPPIDNASFIDVLSDRGLEFEQIKDGHGNPVYLVSEKKHRRSDKTRVEKVYRYGEQVATDRIVVIPVTQEIVEFRLRSRGKDGIEGNGDDETVSSYIVILSEQTKDDENAKPVFQDINFNKPLFNNNYGSISGTVFDSTGSVIPGALVTAQNTSTSEKRTNETNSNGRFFIGNLPPGNYDLRADAAGFNTTVFQGITVRADQAIVQSITLDIGDIAAEVVVTSSAEVLQTQTASISTLNGLRSGSITITIDGVDVQDNILRSSEGFFTYVRPRKDMVEQEPGTLQSDQTSTPRLREYFPETLLWQPELVTDKKGRAKLNFTMADSITTWKVYTIASTKDGKVGVAENEMLSFKSFFADLDPPKFLTVGDEISLPVQIRNYTKDDESVNATMAKADWFSFLNCGEKRTTSPMSSAEFCDSSGAFINKVNVASGKTENAIFGFKAEKAIKGGKQLVTATAKNDSDAIEKPVTVKPDGQENVSTETKFSLGSADYNLSFPANALKNSQTAELKIYPNLMAHVAESVEGLLRRPYGCGEQMISSTYPNLMILKFAYPDGLPDAEDNELKASHISSSIETKAKRNLAKGYEGIIGYQSPTGGFTYWGGKSDPDMSLTAYALRFFSDAEDFIEIDEKMVERAETWLISQQNADGSWTRKFEWESQYNVRRTLIMTSHIARSLAMTNSAKGSRTAIAVDKALNYLQQRNREIDEPYGMAMLGLASLDNGNMQMADWAIGNLKPLAKHEASGVYWNLESNTPFYGWGLTGRIETTALVAQLFMRMGRENADEKELVAKAMSFLMKNKDRYGVWYSTQTTVNVLDALLAGLGNAQKSDKHISVSINGKIVKELTIKPEQIEQISLDLSENISPNSNNIRIHVSDESAMMLNLVAEHYVDWSEAHVEQRNVNESRALRLDYTCDKQQAAIMEEVTCRVEAERIGFRGYGMLLGEIGTPPGADIDRETLKNAVDNNQITRYDVLPDRIIIYMWTRPGGSKFDFKFKPRYGINAQTPASVIYDYYNPEAQAQVKPMRFNIQ